MGERKDFYVYVYFRPDGQPCYIGKGQGQRWTAHERKGSHNQRLSRIIAKAGGSVPRVKIREGLTNDQAVEIERAFIAAIGREDHGAGPLVNMTDGGEGTSGRYLSPETKAEMVERLRRANKGRPISEEEKQKRRDHRKALAPEIAKAIGRKISEANTGSKRGEETKEKLRAAHRNRSPEARAILSAKISAALRGRTPPASAMESRRGRKRSDEARARMAAGHAKRSPEAEALRRQRISEAKKKGSPA